MLDLWMRGVGELPELARDDEGDLLGDVDGVVTDPLDLPRHHIHPDPPLQDPRVVGRLHDVDVLEHAPVAEVDGEGGIVTITLDVHRIPTGRVVEAYAVPE